MAGLGIGPPDFALFEIDDPDERAHALEGQLQPKLADIAEECLPGLGRVAGKELFTHPGKLARRTPILLYGSAYWNEILNFDALVRHGMIAREDLQLFTFADDPATALGLLRSWLRPEAEEPTPAIAPSRFSGDGSGGAPAGGP